MSGFCKVVLLQLSSESFAKLRGLGYIVWFLRSKEIAFKLHDMGKHSK